MRDKVKRFISILMTALMLVNLLPVGALAEGVTATATVISNVTQSAALTTSEKVDNKNIYVYVQIVDANETQKKRINELLELNSSGFYTIGKKEYNENVLPGTYSKWNGYDPRLSNDTTYSENQTVQGKTLPTYTSVYRNLTDTKKENRMIPLEEVSWGVYKFTTGANGYKDSSVGTWHLDGTIRIAQINFPYQVLHIAQYPDGTEKLLGQESVMDGVLGETTKVEPRTYAGYTPKLPIEQKTIDTDTVVRVYYTPNPYKYTVEYYYDNVKDEAKTKTIEGALCGSTINGYDLEPVEGYTFDHDEGLPLTISSNESDNVIRVYYKPDGSRININYSTEQGGEITEPTKDSAYTTTGQIIRNKDDDDNWVASTASVQKGKEDKFAFVGWYKVNESGNKFDRLVSADEYLTAKEIKDSLNGEQGNYRTTKYHARFAKKSDIQYTVNHFEDGTNTMIAPSETKTATPYQYAAGMISADSQQKDIEGYTYKEGKPGSIKIPIKNGQNVLDLYYTRNSYDYTVHYYWNGTETQVAGDTTGTLKAGGTLEVEPTVIEGYTPVSNEKKTITEETNEITFYYYKNVTLTANDAKRTYNGEAQTVEPGYTCSEEDVTFNNITEPSGTGKDVGEHPVTFEENPVGNVDRTGKYKVTEAINGKLVITPITDKVTVTITENSATVLYDGNEHTVTGYKSMTANNGLYDVDASVQETPTEAWTAKGTNVGEYPVGIESKDFKNTNANFSNVEFVVVDGKLEITPITDKVTVTITENSGTATYDGKEHIVSGYKSITADNPLYDVSASVEETPTEAWTAKGTDAGEYPVGIAADDFKNTNANFTNVEFVVVDGALEITPAPVTLQAPIASKSYDGTPLEATQFGHSYLEGLDFADDFESIILTGSQTLVGSSASLITGVIPKEGKQLKNYNFTFVPGTLTITDGTGEEEKPVDPAKVITKTHIPKDMGYNLGEPVTFTISVTNIYNEQKEVTLEEQPGVTFVDPQGAAIGTKATKTLEPGEKWEIQATYTITSEDILAGVFYNTVTATFGDKSWEAKDEVETAKLDTTLNVTKTSNVPDGQKAALGQTITYTIKVQNAGNVPYTNVKVEDPLTGLTETIETLAVGETQTFTTEYVVTEADVLKGSVLNTATATGDEIKDPKSDEPKEPNGGDEVETPTFAPITIKPKDVTATYNGAAITGKDVEITSGKLLEGHKLSAAVIGSGVNAGSYALTLDPEKIKIVDANNKDVSEMYARTLLPGKLIINKRSVLITSPSATKTYDGSALTRPAVTITGDGFVPGELAKAEATGSITKVGSTPNTIQYTTTGAFNAANYSIALSVGTLTVTEKPKPEPRRTFNLTINYVYQNGKRAAASYNRGGLKNGETFDITSPVIAGYTASETVVSGTIYNRDIKVTVIYTADGVNLDDYGVPLGLGNITMNVGDCFE